MDLKKPFDIDKDQYLDDLAFLVLRLGLGFGMLFGHGWGKLLKLFGDEPIQFMNFLGIGATASLALVVFSEVVCSIAIILGVFTRWACFFLIFTMCVAVFMVHFGDPFVKVEKGFLYLVGYMALFFAGAGWYSLDARLGRSH